MADRPAPAPLPAPPPWVVVVELPAGDGRAVHVAAARTATERAAVARAAAHPGRWLWGAAASPAEAQRLVAQARRAGLGPTAYATTAPPPSFLPAFVLAGLAQVPSFVSTGSPAWDLAILGGLGLTAIFSFIRALRRIGPARRAARGLGALAAWAAAPRSEGFEPALLRLEAALGAGNASPALADAVEAAWQRWFALHDLDDAARERHGRRLLHAARAVEAHLADGNAVALARALAELGGDQSRSTSASSA